MEDGRCKLGLAGRFELVQLIEQGASLRTAARALSVSPATAHRWWHRWNDAPDEQRADRSCLRARPPVPRSCPWRLDGEAEAQILDARARTNYGPARLAGLVGYRRSTVWKVLKRHGRSQRRRSPERQSFRRFEWAQPGALLHMDTKRLQRFAQPGHAVTGDRRQRSDGAGHEFAHSIVDDYSRLAYSEVLDDERAATVTAFTERALDWFLEHGIVAERLMTDNAWCYVKNRGLRDLLHARAIVHKRTRPYTPKTNGKVERYQQTLAREWEKGLTYNTSADRRAAPGTLA